MPKISTEPEPAASETGPAPTTAPKPRSRPNPKSSRSIIDTAQPLSEMNDFANILYCGDPGTAKTTDLAAMANLGPIIVINAEGGLRKGALRKRGINVENVRVLPEKPEDLTYEYLDRLHLEIKLALEDEPGSIVGVVWDSVTEITAKLLDNIVDEANIQAIQENKDRDPFFTDIADYGTMGKQVRKLVRRYRDLDCHFGVSALLKRDKDDDGKVIYQPDIIPSLRKDLMGYMDTVIVTDVTEFHGEEEYRGLTKPVGKFRGKDRFGMLPRRLLDPTFDRVWAYIEGDIDIESDPVMIHARERRLALKEQTIEEALAADNEEIDDTGAGEEPSNPDE